MTSTSLMYPSSSLLPFTPSRPSTSTPFPLSSLHRPPRIHLLSPPHSRPTLPYSSPSPQPHPPLPHPFFPPHSTQSLLSAASLLTSLRSPNRFQAPLHELDSPPYRDTDPSHSDSGDSEEEGEEEVEEEREDERGQGDEEEGVIDLSALLLHLHIDRQALPSTASSPSPPRPRFQPPTPTSRHPSTPFPPSPLESAVASALSQLHHHHTSHTLLTFQHRLEGLQSALHGVVRPNVGVSAVGVYMEGEVRGDVEDWERSREVMGGLRRQWEEYHGAQQEVWRVKLREVIEGEERRKREAEERRRREEEAAAKEEQLKRAEEEERKAHQARAAQQAEEDNRRRQVEEQQQRENQQKKEEEAKMQQQAKAQAQEAAAAPAAPGPPSLTPAQVSLQGATAQLQAVRAQAVGFSGANRLKLKVLINRTITQISQTTQSVQNKAISLVSLLRTAQQTGGDEYAFTVETMASKLVAMGETRVRLQLSSAFSFAGVVLHLSAGDAAFFPLFLAGLCEKCIYAVPAYLDRKHYADTKSYMLAIGYVEVTDDKGGAQMVLEEEDAYFERQQGYIALFAAVLQTASNNPNVHGLSHAWQWLARVLNQEPRTATAAVLFAFLSTAGFALSRAYRQQMGKVLAYIQREMMPRMEKLGSKTPARKASVARLQLWLTKEMEVMRATGLCSEPEGRTMPQSQSQSTAVVAVQAGDDRGT